MSRRVLIPVIGKLDGCGQMQRGTVIIERDAGLFTVRRRHCKTTYSLPLSTVADLVVLRVTRANIFAKRIERARLRAARRGR